MALEDDFAQREIRPTVLFDFELDSGELNFWTERYDIQHNGKTYLALSGLEGGISVRQSLELDDLSGDIRLSGVQPEILAIALTDDYQNRPARVHIASKTDAGLVSNSELVLSGLVEDIRIQEGPNDPSLEILIRGVFSDIDVDVDIRYSAADQKLIDPDDTFFAFLESAREAEPPFGT